MRVENITKEQTLLLASIFHQPTFEPYVTYTQRVYCLEPQLDRDLLRPDFLHRLVQLPQSYYTPLCGLHKILDAKLVHQFFILLATEVGVRLNSLVVAGRDKLGHETWDSSILNLRSLHGAWLQPEVFSDTFGKTLNVPRDGFSDEDYTVKWVREKDNCEACILARVGGDLATVFDLHMVLKSRTRTKNLRKYKGPRLTSLVDGWLSIWKAHHGRDGWGHRLEWNRLRAERLKLVRKELARQNRRGRQRPGNETTGASRHRVPRISPPMVEHIQQRADASKHSGSSVKPELVFSGEANRSQISSDPRQHGNGFDQGLSDNEDEEEEEIRHTVHDAENEIIDCYAALLSTPFLPEMDFREHQRHTSKLRRHSTMMALRNTQPPWPMVGSPEVQQRLARSQSTKPRRSSNYSESVYSRDGDSDPTTTYSPPRQQWQRLNDLQRSNSTQKKRSSERTWKTVSVTPSVAITCVTPSQRDSIRTRRNDRAFDAIAEEPTSSRTASRFIEDLVSPVEEYDPRTTSARDSRQHHSGGVSPISPLSPTDLSIVRESSRGRRRESDQGRRTTRSRSSHHRASTSNQEAKDNRRSEAVKVISRLSRPFDAPVVEPGSLLDAVKKLRVRDSTKTDVTRWSAVYGSDAERIKRQERGSVEGNSVPVRLNSNKKERRW